MRLKILPYSIISGVVSGIAFLSPQIYFQINPPSLPIYFITSFLFFLFIVILSNIINKNRSYKHSLLIGFFCSFLSILMHQLYWVLVIENYLDFVLPNLMFLIVFFGFTALIGLFFRGDKKNKDVDALDSNL